MMDQLEELQKAEVQTTDGKVFAYTYTLEDDHLEMQKDVFHLFQGRYSTGYLP